MERPEAVGVVLELVKSWQTEQKGDVVDDVVDHPSRLVRAFGDGFAGRGEKYFIET